MRRAISYFLLGTLLWVIVDCTTTGAIKNPSEYYSTYMPTILIFYLGYPLVFSILIYRYKLAERYLFIATIVSMLIIEVAFTHNPALFSFPLLLLGIPSAVAIYCLLTFLPKWVIEHEVRDNIGKTTIMVVAYALIAFLTYFGN